MATLRAMVALGILAGVGCACGGSGPEPEPPRPSCLASPRDFRPTANVIQEWAQANEEIAAIPATFRLNQCNTKYDDVEGIYCGPKIDAFCQQQCTSESDRVACRQTHREDLMKDCRAQAFPDFVRAVPSCCPVKLEGSDLVSTTDACPPT